MVTGLTEDDIPSLDRQLFDLLDKDVEPQEDAIKALIVAGASPSATFDRRGETAMHAAARHGHSNSLRVMVGLGAVLDVRTSDGITPLMMAVRKNKAEAVKVLLELGADPCLIGRNFNYTVLHLAALDASCEALEVLLQTSARSLLEKTERLGMTPLLVLLDAASGRRYFADEPDNQSFVARARKTARLLLDAGADPTKRDRNFHSMLAVSAGAPLPDITQELLATHPAQEDRDEALTYAVLSHQLPQIQCLLAAGADALQIDEAGDHLIQLAVASTKNMKPKEMGQIIGLLADYGVDVNLRNVNGHTVLQEAMRSDVAPEVKWALLDLGAEIPPYAQDWTFVTDRKQEAQARFDAVMKADALDVEAISARDLVWFSNIGMLEETLSPAVWRGHCSHLRQLLSQLPPALSQHALAIQPDLAHMVMEQGDQPAMQVSSWNHQSVVADAPGKGHTP